MKVYIEYVSPDMAVWWLQSFVGHRYPVLRPSYKRRASRKI